MRNHKYYVSAMGIRNDKGFFFADYFINSKDFKTKEFINDFIKQIKENNDLQSCFILNVIKLKR